MRNQSQHILRALRGAPMGFTNAELSKMLGIPAPSVRRAIVQLRRDWWPILLIRRRYLLVGL